VFLVFNALSFVILLYYFNGSVLIVIRYPDSVLIAIMCTDLQRSCFHKEIMFISFRFFLITIDNQEY
jgi:hypothetical protein